MSANGRKIVVGVDGSEHSDRALAWAIEEAKLREARLQVVSVWHVPALVYGAPGFTPPIGPDVGKAFRDVASETATAAAQTARDGGVEADVEVDQGQTVDKLLEAAEGADMLVVGSRGHGGFSGLMLGSVSAQCAHHAPCPIVIVRPRAGD
jgi:nucleotide-binding universal stress UspA family protein